MKYFIEQFPNVFSMVSFINFHDEFKRISNFTFSIEKDGTYVLVYKAKSQLIN